MGKHSSKSAARKRARINRNLLAVALTVVVAAGSMFLGIAFVANRQQQAVPDPFIVSEPHWYDFLTGANDEVDVPSIEELEYENGAPFDAGVQPGVATTDDPAAAAGEAQPAMRYCPATGCGATTCHAETGEPPPGR